MSRSRRTGHLIISACRMPRHRVEYLQGGSVGCAAQRRPCPRSGFTRVAGRAASISLMRGPPFARRTRRGSSEHRVSAGPRVESLWFIAPASQHSGWSELRDTPTRSIGREPAQHSR